MKSASTVIAVLVAFFVGTCVGGTCVSVVKSTQPTSTYKSGVPPVTKTQPVKVAEPTPPAKAVENRLEFSGPGHMVTEMFNLNPGLVRAEYSFTGSGNFIVHVLDGQGNLVEGLVNEIGTISGSTAFRIDQPGTYLLDVTADGSWQISLY